MVSDLGGITYFLPDEDTGHGVLGPMSCGSCLGQRGHTTVLRVWDAEDPE